MKLQTTLAATLIASALHATAAEAEIQLGQLPPEVQKSIQQTVGSGRITKTTRETEEKGATIYEVAYTEGKKKFEAEFSSAGKLLVVDEQVSLSDVPADARKVIEQETAGGKIVKVEKATEGRKTYFEAEYKKDGAEHEVRVSPAGKLLGRE